MGCMQVRVKPIHSVNQIQSNKSQLTVSHVESIQNASNELDESTTFRPTMYSTPVTMFETLSVTPVISIQSEDLIQHLEFIASKTFVRSPQLNINETFNEFDTSISRYNISTSRINVSKSADIDSNVSEITEVSSMFITSSELDRLSSSSSFTISSTSNSEHKTSKRNINNKILSIRPKRPTTGQTSTSDGIWSESDKSASDRTKTIQMISVQPKKTLANTSSNESDESKQHHLTENNLNSNNLKLIADNFIAVLRSTSTQSSNSSYQSNEFMSELTTNESDKHGR